MEEEKQRKEPLTLETDVKPDTAVEEVEEPERDHYALPSPEVLREIAEKQEAKHTELLRTRSERKQQDDRDVAARLIQKNYRGYRTRRALQGYGLDPSTRWLEAVKEGEIPPSRDPTNGNRLTLNKAKYFNSTRPMSRSQRNLSSPTPRDQVKARWLRAGTIAYRAGSDDTSSDDEVQGLQGDERAQAIEKRRREKKEREKYAKVMGLEYFLEMVDHKHRYGSNLRRYHTEWKASDTNENFFYWLDHGEGKDLDLEDRPRSRLDYECVRYLSREERQKYLVHIDKTGRFIWAKNDQPVTTSVEYKDSINGIVPIWDETPTWREVTTGVKPEPSPPGSETSSISGLSTGSHEDSSKYTNDELHDAKGLAKLNHLSADALANHMLRKTTKKNTWIFVADTSFRMFIGIKQSGAFQHSSFLRGARVAAAGLIKCKRGQLRKLSPLSGHYAPPLKNFREFVHTLKDEGADLSRLNLGRSYAVLLGLEAYVDTKKHAQTAEQGVKDMFNPEAKKQREQAALDKSKSAAREREIIQQQEQERRKRSLSYRLKQKLRLDKEHKKSVDEKG